MMDLNYGYANVIETPNTVVTPDDNDTIRDCIERFAAGNMFSKDLIQPFYSIWQEHWGRKLIYHTEYERHPAESELTLNQVFQYAIKAGKRSTISIKVPSMPLCDGQFENMILHSNILDIDKAIEADLWKGESSFVLTGNPGVGKSIFLSYLLVKRLSEGKPTFYHCPASSPESPSDVYLFHAGGVARLTQTNTNVYLPLISARILGIMDPHIGPYQPPMMFFQQAHPFVYALSAGDEHERWLPKLKDSFRTYNLKDWEPKEIFQARGMKYWSSPPTDAFDAMYRLVNYSPRHMLAYLDHPDKFWENRALLGVPKKEDTDGAVSLDYAVGSGDLKGGAPR